MEVESGGAFLLLRWRDEVENGGSIFCCGSGNAPGTHKPRGALVILAGMQARVDDAVGRLEPTLVLVVGDCACCGVSSAAGCYSKPNPNGEADFIRLILE